MKKYLIYLLIAFLGIFLTGCNKFLTLVPDSEYSVEGAYKTQIDFEQAIAAVYSQQQKHFQSSECWFRGIISRCDETTGGWAGDLPAGYVFGLNVFTDTPVNAWSYREWQSFWKIISRCNIILGKIHPVTFPDPALKDNIKGEAYILRAWAYHYLAMQYGGMPLIATSVTADEAKKIARSTKAQTLAFAEEDYKKAATLLPVAWPAVKLGRATKYAAEGMLARLYMFQSNFAAAKPLLSDVISSGKYAIESNYKNCFLDSKDNGTERVWEVQFTGGLLGEGQGFSNGCLPEQFKDLSIMPFPGGSTAMPVAKSFYKAYEIGDKRRDISILKGVNLTTGRDTAISYILKFIPFDAYTPRSKVDWANNLPILRYTDVKMMYAEALNETGYIANGEAFSILNDVRTRAGLPLLTATQLPSQASFRNAIIIERKFEFAFEGIRWFDLVRWGIAQNVMNQFFALPEQGNGLYSMKPHQTIFPIPFQELSNYNDDKIMWQNPGY
jgi:hypothetical protein